MKTYRVAMILREITRAVVEVRVESKCDTETIKDIAWSKFDKQVAQDEKQWGKKLEQENGTTIIEKIPASRFRKVGP